MNCTVCGKFLNWGTTTISEPICSEWREVRRLNYSSVDAMRDEIAALRERLATAERRIEYLDAFLTAPPAPATPPARPAGADPIPAFAVRPKSSPRTEATTPRRGIFLPQLDVTPGG